MDILHNTTQDNEISIDKQYQFRILKVLIKLGSVKGTLRSCLVIQHVHQNIFDYRLVSLGETSYQETLVYCLTACKGKIAAAVFLNSYLTKLLRIYFSK